MAAVWYRPDNMGPEFYNSEAYRDLYKVARERMVEIKVDRSNITRGWTYNSNIYLVKPTGTFYEDAPHVERNRYVPFGAGNGRNPITATIDAIRICRLHTDPIVACAILQAELWLLQREVGLAREREKRQAAADALAVILDDLTALVRSYTVPVAAPPPQPMLAKPGEDDDL